MGRLGSWWAILAFVVYGALYGGAADPRWHECGHGTALRLVAERTGVFPGLVHVARNHGGGGRVRHHSDTIVVGRRGDRVPRPIDVRAWAVNLLGLTSVPAMVRRIVRHACGRLDADVAGYVPSELHRRRMGGRGYLVVIVSVLAACVVTAGSCRCCSWWGRRSTGRG